MYFSVPPRPPIIVNESGRESGSFLGPYPEGTTVRASCEVSGGKPIHIMVIKVLPMKSPFMEKACIIVTEMNGSEKTNLSEYACLDIICLHFY